MSSPAMKLSALRALAEAAPNHDVTVVGERGGWVVRVRDGRERKTLTGKDGEPRVFAKLDTAARQLMALGLSTFEVEGGRYEAAQLRPDRPDRSRAMKAANDYARWLKAEADRTATRVAAGKAELATPAQAEARGKAKRAELERRRKASAK